MNDFIFELLKILIVLLGTVLTYKVIPLIKTKLTKEQMDQIYFWVQVAVNAAEQIWTEKGQGIQKKDFVIKFLRNQGFDLTEVQLDTLIEGAVYELKQFHELL